MISGIYALRCSVTGKVYVGSARNIERRYDRHVRDLNRGDHINRKLQRAWKKHGAAAFSLEVLETCEVEGLLPREQFWLDKLDACASGYNIRLDAASNAGLRYSEEHRKKIATSMSGPLNHRYGKPALNRGVPPSVETLARISDASRAIKRPPGYFRDLRMKVKQTRHSESTKAKMRKPKSPEHIEKLRAILRARNADPAFREANSARQTGVPNLNSLGKKYRLKAAQQ